MAGLCRTRWLSPRASMKRASESSRQRQLRGRFREPGHRCSRIAHMAVNSEVMGQRIAEARAQAGLTQAELASAVDLERSVLTKIETGTRRVSAIELAHIA